jgi:CRP-like cAMP-binding protein
MVNTETNPIDFGPLPTATRLAPPPRNSLLAGLSPRASAELGHHLREQSFREGTILWQAGDRIAQVIFPVSGIVSIRVPTKDGHGIEVASVGSEGAAGFQDESRLLPEVSQAVVQIAGSFLTIPAQAFALAAHRVDEIDRLATLCNGWLLLQSQQTAACNAIHTADARFCRWLMRASQALGQDFVPVTQEAIAQALGIRRTTATLIAQQLQERRIISYSRGKIAIRDRAGLRSAACECCLALDRAHWPSEVFRADAAG